MHRVPETFCCSRQCQTDDRKRHKKECKQVAKEVREEQAQNKAKNCLQVGQSQQVLQIIRFLHHYATISKEMAEMQTNEARMMQ